MKVESGYVFTNGITLIERTSRKKHKNYICIFKCHCGKIFEKPFYGKNYSTSCGCANTFNRKEPGVALYNAAVGKMIPHIKRRGIELKLSNNEMIEIIKMPCFYCGNIGSNTLTNNECLGKTIKFNGIDRIDSSIGYLKSNCVPCCKYCNWAKNDQSVDDFKNHTILIYNHLKLGVKR